MFTVMWKREECKNPDPSVDICEKYVTPFQTTGIPIIIGLSLFLVLSIVLFVIVRRNRKRQHAQEAEKHRQIDDDIELEFTAPPESRGHKEQRRSPDIENPFEPPPKY
ncbi:uncharacterized protein Z518_10700 [Rhinocladiella mackenziei CBS 650.93]|uniref:Uncharacterized protein n=1 Tax=Rhinocladiella mackenziei CBS 650.93 TaxID=1442369 RepID=A0A0D2GN17_9EURO|nr:uncharacterized protein Z518_10700 [Rhinocladiella mackenziei CBS 650.93]KIW99772.1 hypothetical protein Z518_10700 [Rhinocladiella mackenziei CBS 650.93]